MLTVNSKTITKTTVQDFCRVCLCELLTTTPISAKHGQLQDDVVLRKCLRLTTHTTFAPDDVYSKQLCEPCCSKMRIFYEFRELAFCCMLAARETLEEETLSEGSIDNLQQFCRTCLQKLPAKPCNDELTHLTNSEIHTWLARFAELEECLPMPQLPKRLCEDCYKVMRDLEEFRQLAQTSLEQVKQLCAAQQSKDVGMQSGAMVNVVDIEASKQVPVPRLKKKATTGAEKPNIFCVEKLPVVSEISSLIQPESAPAVHDKDESLTKGNDKICDEPLVGDKLAAQNNTTKEVSSVQETSTKPQPKRRSLLSYLTEHSEGGSEPHQSTSPPKTKKQKELKKKISKRKEFQCQECSKIFRKQLLLEAHVRRDHEGLDQPFKCSQCPRTYRMRHFLHKHLNKVHNRINIKINNTITDDLLTSVPAAVQPHHFPCSTCHKVFKRKTRLADHMRLVHELLRPFKCKHCNESFNTRSECDIHELHGHNVLNNGEQLAESIPQADNSSIAQTISAELPKASDKKAHTDVQPKQQNDIGDGEKIKEPIKVLKQRHESFSCSHCIERFATRKTWQRHEETHEVVPVSKSVCNICNCGFKQAAMLSKHMKKHNNAKTTASLSL